MCKAHLDAFARSSRDFTKAFEPHKLLRHIAGILVNLRLGSEPPKIFLDRARLSLGLSPDDLVSGALP